MSEYNGKLEVTIIESGWRRMDESFTYHLMKIKTDGGVDDGCVPTVDEIVQIVLLYLKAERFNDNYVCQNGRRRPPELPSKIERLQSILDEFKKIYPWPEGIY